MARIEETIDVNVPVTAAYNQWTQFEEFPEFMEGIESVEQLDDTHLLWSAEIGGKKESWKAEITEQHPDHRVAWKGVEGAGESGCRHVPPARRGFHACCNADGLGAGRDRRDGGSGDRIGQSSREG